MQDSQSYINQKLTFIFKTATILIVVSLSIFLKLKDIDNFTELDNFFTNHDAYRYARYAVEIQNGTYSRIDYLADVPDLAANQYPPPLLSQIAVWLSDLSGVKIQYFFLILPPILSVLFVIPIYYWLQPLKNDFVTLGAITMGLFNFQYFVRTRMGYFDTDCMILFFVFTILLLINKSAVEKEDKIKSYGYIVLSGLAMMMFRWWYDHLFFVLIFIVSIFISSVFNKNCLMESIKKILLFIVLSSPVELFYYILNSPFINDYLYGSLMNIKSYKMLINVYASVGELLPVNIKQAIWFTTDNYISFMIGIIFGIVLFFKHFHIFIVAFPIICLGLLSFYQGSRYLIYLGPFIGIGFGYFIFLSVSFIKQKTKININLLFIIGCLVTSSFLIPPQITQFTTKPMHSERTVINLKKINELTYDNAYIWSWWGLGNPIQYYSNRAVYMDNSHFHPLKIYGFIKSMTSNDEDFSYKVISYYTNNLSKEYDKFSNNLLMLIRSIEGYQVPISTPVYIMLYDGMLSKFVLKDNVLPKDEAEIFVERLPINNTICNLKEKLFDCGGILLEPDKNHFDIADNKLKESFKKIVVINKMNSSQKVYTLNHDLKEVIYLISAKDGKVYKITAHEDFEKTMLYRMMILSEDNFKRFDLVYEDYPYMVLYKIK